MPVYPLEVQEDLGVYKTGDSVIQVGVNAHFLCLATQSREIELDLHFSPTSNVTMRSASWLMHCGFAEGHAIACGKS